MVASLRDILQDRVKPDRNEETAALVKRHFDLVMVHGDPNFAALELSFPLAAEISDKVAYTGLVAAPPALPAAERYDVMVSAGGGAAGATLARLAPLAARRTAALFLVSDHRSEPAGGGFRSGQGGAPANLSVFRFRQDFRQLLAAVGVSVSQAGYNTVCDVLQAGCRSLLVPFTEGGETEQAARAWRLEQLGLASIIAEEGLTAEDLADAVAAGAGKPPPNAHAIDLDGAARSADLLSELMATRAG